MTAPAISIGLPFFNVEATISSAVQTILAQSFTDWELLLMDDGSSDASLEIARSFTDPRIHVYSDGRNLGISARLNHSVRLARGKYFFRMDGDDLAFPERLRVQYEFLEQHPDIHMVASNAIFFRTADEIFGTLNVATTHDAIVARPCVGFHMPHPSWAGQLEWFVANPYQGAVNGAEDQELLYRTHRCSRFACLPEPLIGYRESGPNFGKRLNRRKILARAMFNTACQQRYWKDIACIGVSFFAKSIADFITLKLGLFNFKTKFIAPDPDQKQWLLQTILRHEKSLQDKSHGHEGRL